MAYPSGVTTATLRLGRAFSAFADDARISVSIKPFYGANAKRIIWSATGDMMPSFSKPYSAGPGNSLDIVVPVVDQAGWVDGSGNAITMWSYVLDISVALGEEVITWTQPVQPLAGQAIIDVDEVPDGSLAAPSSAPLPAVLSVNGQTGHVTVAGGPGGSGLPAGGTIGQALLKISGTDGDAGWSTLTKSNVGLGNVQNLAPENMPVSNDMIAALLAKADLVGGKIPASQLPAVAISNTFPVASQAAMLALTAEVGDVAVRSDNGQTYILMAEPASTLGNWVALTAVGQVSSVAGRTGAVTLGISDIATLATELGSRLRTLDSGTPSNAVGSDGNWLWRMSDLALFKKVAGVWVQQTVIGTGSSTYKSIMREAFQQDGDAVVDIIGQPTISNYPRKILPNWTLSNDNVLSAGATATARIFYKDASNVEQVIAQDITISGSQRLTTIALTGTLPTVPAGKELYGRCTVANTPGSGAPAYPTYTVGTFIGTDSSAATSLGPLVIPGGANNAKVGKIAVVAVASTTGPASLPSVPAGTPPWTTLVSRSDTAASLWMVIAWKPIQTGETGYTVTFGGSYPSVGGVIVLETFDNTTLFDPTYDAVVATNNSFALNPGTVPTDATSLDNEITLGFWATRASAAEYNTYTVTGSTKLVEKTTTRDTLANVAIAVTSQQKATAGTVTQPTVTTPYNSRWLVNGYALNPYVSQIIGASNLALHGEVEVQV